MALNRVNTRQGSSVVATTGYRNDRPAPAVVRTDADRFTGGVRTIARRLLFSAVGISDGDREFLGDLSRAECRYPMRAIQRLIACSRASIRPEDREALPELVRAEILTAVPAVRDLPLAFDLETRAQCATDPLQRVFERRPSCRATRDQLIEALTAQLNATRASLDAVQAVG